MHKSFAPERRPAEGQQRLRSRLWQIGLLFATILGLSLTLSGRSVRAAPAATSMTVSNPYCVQLQVNSGACMINVSWISVSSTDPLFSHVEISINGKVRAYFSAFFEQSIYMTKEMLGEGLQVSCGLPGASGNAAFGNQYQVGISAFVTGSSPIVDTAVVTCPFFVSTIFLPAINK